MDSLEKTKRRRPEARRGSWWWGFGLTLAALFVLPVSSAWAQPTSTEMVEMRDGVHLATDLYLPTAGSGPWPVVLQRTPYNKDDMHSQGNAFSQNGVVAVIQDTRGKFASEGTDCVFLCDGAGALQDGYDTLTWIDNQTWSDGHVVTVGGVGAWDRAIYAGHHGAPRAPGHGGGGGDPQLLSARALSWRCVS